MPKLEVTMTVDKVTKGAVHYHEVETDAQKVFPVIYIRKEALVSLGTNPETIKVTVETI